jgi:hypothetical protein
MDIFFHSHRLVEGRVVVLALWEEEDRGAPDQLSVAKILARDALRSGGHWAQDGAESADAQRIVVWNREAVMLRGLRLQDNVATDWLTCR